MTARSKSSKTVFVCQNCGNDTPRWAGKCPQCGEWNTLVEEKVQPSRSSNYFRRLDNVAEAVELSQVDVGDMPRIESGIKEFDRVLGDGLVPGSLLLSCGDPGIGKSTLLLQVISRYAAQGYRVLYVSGEESLKQVRMRSIRLGIPPENLWLLSEVSVDQIIKQIEKLDCKIAVIDSIQTMFSPDFDSAPGSVTQVRESAMRLLQLAKSRSVSLFLIGHVTKDGSIAGPRVLEHMVDVMLYLEGDRQYQYRLLRGIKNRFGSTHEIGIFELGQKGMIEVSNPSQLFLSDQRNKVSGTAVTCAVEGTRPILLEVQALTSSANFGMPQRTAAGIDHKRLALLLAILEKRAGYHIGQFDVFVKIAGGLRMDDPSADLAVLMAIAASYNNLILDTRTLFLGEVGLGGEIRPVAQLPTRLREAVLLGFETAFLPRFGKIDMDPGGLKLIELDDISDALERIRSPKKFIGES